MKGNYSVPSSLRIAKSTIISEKATLTITESFLSWKARARRDAV